LSYIVGQPILGDIKSMRGVLLLLMMVAMLVMSPSQAIAEGVATRGPLAAEGITLEIDFGNDTVLTFTNLNGTNALDVTESVVSVEKEWYGDLVYVTSIAGVPNDAENGWFWQYWVNNELAPIAANKYNLEENDIVSWRRLSEEGTTTTSYTSQDFDISLLAWAGLLTILGVSFLGMLYIMKMRR
jgi:hypothetical protein